MCPVPTGAPDFVVPVAEAWDGGQDKQVIGRRVLRRVLDLQASSRERKSPQSPHNPCLTFLERGCSPSAHPGSGIFPATSKDSHDIFTGFGFAETPANPEQTSGALPSHSLLFPMSCPSLSWQRERGWKADHVTHTDRLRSTEGGSLDPTPTSAPLLKCPFKMPRTLARKSWKEVTKRQTANALRQDFPPIPVLTRGGPAHR